MVRASFSSFAGLGGAGDFPQRSADVLVDPQRRLHRAGAGALLTQRAAAETAAALVGERVPAVDLGTGLVAGYGGAAEVED